MNDFCSLIPEIAIGKRRGNPRVRKGIKEGVFALVLLASASIVASQVHAATDISGFIVFTNPDPNVNSGFNRATAASQAAAYAPYPGQAAWNSTFFGKLGGDCTNFVSWVWNTAGIAMNNTGSQSTGWWFTNTGTGRSYSWTGAQEFTGYWGRQPGAASGGQRVWMQRNYSIANAKIYSDQIYGDLWKGDVIQYVNSVTNKATHTHIVHDYHAADASTGYKPKLYMAQHSSDGTSSDDGAYPSAPNPYTNDWWRSGINFADYLLYRETAGTGTVITLRVKQATN
jgi:hypothetical protein